LTHDIPRYERYLAALKTQKEEGAITEDEYEEASKEARLHETLQSERIADAIDNATSSEPPDLVQNLTANEIVTAEEVNVDGSPFFSKAYKELSHNKHRVASLGEVNIDSLHLLPIALSSEHEIL